MTCILRAPKLSNNRGKYYLLFDPKAPEIQQSAHRRERLKGSITPMKFYFQVLTTPTADTPGTTIALHFPQRRYLFGQVSEGTQRVCTENGTKLSHVTDVFLSGRLDWNNTGGLIGVILTQADGLASASSQAEESLREKEERRRQREAEAQRNGKKAAKTQAKQTNKTNDEQHPTQRVLTIHGGRNLAHTLATARRFVFRQGTPVHMKEYDGEAMSKKLHLGAADPFEEPTWSDENIKVWAMPVSPSSAAPPRPQSPRKRSLDEFRETPTAEHQVDPRARDQLLRQSVVADMFDSSWALDALEETLLADVKMPAVMFVRNPDTKDLERYNPPSPESGLPLPNIKVLVRKPWPGAAVAKIPTTTRNDEALCYVVKSHDIRGAFDPNKARALNIKSGPAYGALARGESVLSEDGKVITPDMVIGPSRPGKGLAIADLPTAEYVESFITRPEWKSPAITNNLATFVWILGPGVGAHPGLREFIEKMSHCKHLVSSTDHTPNYLAMQRVAALAIRMARLRPDNYPVPYHDNLSIPQTKSHSTESTTTTDMSLLQPAKPGLIIQMEPGFQIQDSEVVERLNTAQVLREVPISAERRGEIIKNRLKKPQPQRKLRQFLKNLPGTDVEVITLGTGSSLPSKYRNVSSTLIHVPNQGYYLLDCGESTLGQLKRVFNPEQLREVLQNLRMIWISHLHADHHLGTVSVIKAWYQENYPDGAPESDSIEMDMSKILREKRLFVVSERMMIEWLEEYAGVEDFGFGKLVPLAAQPYTEPATGFNKTAFYYRHCRSDGSYPDRDLDTSNPVTTELTFTNRDAPLTDLLCKATCLSDLLTVRVSHCRGAMAVSLVFPDGFKASFSGDCRPTPKFAEIGKDSTILIHEATFQDNMIGSAIAKKHSTVSEAIDIGRMMRARSILLTHFSQRYQKLTYVDPDHRDPAAQPPPSGVAAATPTAAGEKVAGVPAKELGEDDHGDSRDPQNSSPSTPGLPVVPIVTAFDYMRVRIRDMFDLAAYSPAVEKLFQMIERAADLETEKLKEEREAEEAIKQGKKSKKSNKQQPSKEKSPKPETTSPSREGGDVSQSSDLAPPAPPKHLSVWSASESESGWSTSDYESEPESQRK